VGAWLVGAWLVGAWLVGASLVGAWLVGAWLVGHRCENEAIRVAPVQQPRPSPGFWCALRQNRCEGRGLVCA
jgi:hypothetical protein